MPLTAQDVIYRTRELIGLCDVRRNPEPVVTNQMPHQSKAGSDYRSADRSSFEEDTRHSKISWGWEEAEGWIAEQWNRVQFYSPRRITSLHGVCNNGA